jgi:hypothetical protein
MSRFTKITNSQVSQVKVVGTRSMPLQVTIGDNGQLRLGAAADSMLGKPEWANVYYDEPSQTFAVGATTEQDADKFQVTRRPQNNGQPSSGRIALKRLFYLFKLAVPEYTTNFPAQVEDDADLGRLITFSLPDGFRAELAASDEEVSPAIKARREKERARRQARKEREQELDTTTKAAAWSANTSPADLPTEERDGKTYLAGTTAEIRPRRSKANGESAADAAK